MAVASVVREIEAEIAREEERRSREEMILPQASEPETMPVEPAVPPVTEELPKEPSEPPAPEELPVGTPAPEEISPEPEAPVFPEELPPASDRKSGTNRVSPASRSGDSRSETETAPSSGRSAPEKDPSLSRSPELENPEVLRYLQETEDVTADPEKLWQELRKSYPKIQPFDYESGCEILTIRPQDIGRLPRESWVYGNNSFLLHGYYNFRYIILFRLGNKDGPRPLSHRGPRPLLQQREIHGIHVWLPQFCPVKKAAAQRRPLWILVYGYPGAVKSSGSGE